ncbi:MAG: energy transducer TonB [Ignavibacteria bacterium]|jgi:TonB family protein|nr:energy transducer TonB [Ignavibacteria bacterium]
MSTNNIVAAIPTKSTYGAVEIKEFIRKNTWRSFIITIIAVILLLIINIVLALTSTGSDNVIAPPVISKFDLIQAPQEESGEIDEAAPPPDAQQIVNYGMEARAGTPVPIPDADITQDLAEFAEVKDLERALRETGTVDITQAPDFNIEDLKQEKIVAPPPEVIPRSDEFIPVEKEPGVDLAELQKRVVYPDMARQLGIEGRVVIRVYVDKTGKPLRTEVLSTDSDMLNKAAIDAIMKTTFTPAIQNKQAIGCWVSIPISFKLR